MMKTSRMVTTRMMMMMNMTENTTMMMSKMVTIRIMMIIRTITMTMIMMMLMMMTMTNDKFEGGGRRRTGRISAPTPEKRGKVIQFNFVISWRLNFFSRGSFTPSRRRHPT